MQRSAEIGAAVRECQRAGGSVLMLTLTLRHRRGDDLADLFDFLKSGWRSAVGSRAWSGRDGDRDRFRVAGLVRVVEATVSRPGTGHGWHLHIHALAFLMADPSIGLRPDATDVLADMMEYNTVTCDRAWLGRVVLAARIFARWVSGVTKSGGRVPLAAGCDLRVVDDSGAEFLGGYLQKSTYDVAAKLGAEIAAGGETKTGTAGHLAPFEILRELAQEGPGFGLRTPRSWEIIDDLGHLALLDHGSGEITPLNSPGLWSLWHAWEIKTRGRRQISWSHRPRQPLSARERFWLGILDARGRTAQRSDDDLAAVELDGMVLGEISRSTWYQHLVWRPSWLVDILDMAEQRGAAGVRDWMLGHGMEYVAG